MANSPEFSRSEHDIRLAAISEVHTKLTLAQKKDLALSSVGAEGTHRHSQLHIPEREITDRSYGIVLAPSYADRHYAKVAQVSLRIPHKKWDEAGKLLQDMYQPGIITNDLLGITVSFDADRPQYVPTMDVFGRAVKATGDTVDFLLNPAGLFVYDDPKAIQPADISASLDGQYYAIDSKTSADDYLQNWLAADWFDARSLHKMLESYEPVPTSGPNINSGAA